MISAFSYQLFITGFVHGDPHPGNVLVRPSPHNSYTSQIVLLDHGLYVRVEEEMRTSLCKIFKSIVKNDVEAVQNESAKVGVKGQLDVHLKQATPSAVVVKQNLPQSFKCIIYNYCTVYNRQQYKQEYYDQALSVYIEQSGFSQSIFCSVVSQCNSFRTSVSILG